MARLPSGADVNRVSAPSSSPGISVKAIDYGPQAQAAKGLANAIGGNGGLIQGLMSFAEAGNQAANQEEEFSLNKRLLEFKLDTEMELENQKRTMQPGAVGYSEQWAETYKERASAFVGKDDANVPAAMRGKVGLALKQHEVALSERAQRAAEVERDRYEIDGLETTLGRTRSVVEADPGRRDEMLTEGQKLIDTARISPAARGRLLKHYAKELDKTSAVSRLMRAKTAEDFDALKNDLAPDVADQQTAIDSPSFLGERGAASIRYNNPGAMYPGASSKKFGATHTEIIGGGHKIAVFPDAVSGAAAQFDLLSTKYAGKSLRDAIAMWSGGNSVDTYLSVIQRETGISPNQKLTREMLSDPAIAIPMAKAMAVQEAGKSYPLSDEQWQAAHRWATTGEQPASGGLTKTADASGAVPQGYAGPFSRLSISERRTLWSQAETQRKTLINEVDKVITAYEGNAALGKLPPDDQMAEIKRRVESMNDPVLRSKFDGMVGLAETTRKLENLQPMRVEQVARDLDAQLATNATPEQQKRLEHVRTLAKAMDAEVKQDPLTWAAKRAIEVPTALGADGGPVTSMVKLDQLDFNAPDIDDRLQRRAETARSVGKFYGQGPQFFTKIERHAFASQLKTAGVAGASVLGRISAAFGADAPSALNEILPKEPELARAGHLIATKGDPEAVKDIFATYQRRQDPNYKAVPAFPANEERQHFADVVGDVFDRMPSGVSAGQEADAVLRAAQSIYEARNKTGKPDPEKFKEAVKLAMGERTSNGNTYGGVATVGSWYASKYKLRVPSNMDQSRFKETVDAIDLPTLTAAGVAPPMSKKGPMAARLPLSDVVGDSVMMEVGPGRYVFNRNNTGQGPPQVVPDANGKTFVLDMNKLEPALRKKVASNVYLD